MTHAEMVEAREMRMEWPTDAGTVIFKYPSNLSEQDVAEVRALLEVAFAGMVRRAATGRG